MIRSSKIARPFLSGKAKNHLLRPFSAANLVTVFIDDKEHRVDSAYRGGTRPHCFPGVPPGRVGSD